MSRIRPALTFGSLAFVLFASGAAAQVPTAPAYRAPVSPYLNLLRGGNPTFLNYYGFVRPQLDAQQAFQSLQGQVQSLATTQNATAIGADGQPLPVTGQPFGYFNHRSYFLNNRGGSGGGFGSGGGNFGGGSFGAGNVGNRGVNTGNQMARPQGVGNFR
ncbi:hypothetical protein PX52LOC_02466 [Limnoglobus roseus]|uniref:Uncharacterized protein n=1 Tax=Limnoglobus roseus TaxID=2598579 RepID=A0A5C1A8I8_9BACT|nr:hypothetical protein PX52LOC_02466 [Limnoglobus roseus]